MNNKLAVYRLVGRFLGIALVLTSQVVFADDAIKGFDGEVLKQVLSGKIVTTEAVNTKTEAHVFLRSFFPKTSPEAYLKLVTNHPKYPSLFSDIVDAKTTSVDKDKNVYEYELDVLYQAGFFTFHVYPKGRHTATFPKDAKSEGFLKNDILNYTDMFELAQEGIRQIPYQGGILVEDEIHVKLKKATAQSTQVKKMMVDQFTKYTVGFRKELSGQE